MKYNYQKLCSSFTDFLEAFREPAYEILQTLPSLKALKTKLDK